MAIVAIDPSSPFSGGAVLGDRIRMQNHYADPASIFDRSGPVDTTVGCRRRHVKWSALDAAGYAIILVETVGAGQTELEVLIWQIRLRSFWSPKAETPSE